MPIKVYVNLPVKDVEKTREFFTKTGFKFDEKASNKNCGCMIVGDGDYVMMLSEDFFINLHEKGNLRYD